MTYKQKARAGRKGGLKKGKAKVRGDGNFYRDLALKGVAKRKAEREAGEGK